MIQLSLVPEEELTIDGRAVIEDQDGNMVALVEEREDAAAIVNACLAHDILVKALGDIALCDSSEGYTAMRALKEAGLS